MKLKHSRICRRRASPLRKRTFIVLENWEPAVMIKRFGIALLLSLPLYETLASPSYAENVASHAGPDDSAFLTKDDPGGVIQHHFVEEIVVTGSRIRRDGFESLQPELIFDSSTIENRNAIDLATVLNEQSGFVPSFAPTKQASPSEIGQNYINYLGLGIQRTLTLVNGLRFPAGVSATSGGGGLSVDLNTIPESLVERVEVIAIGGAPAYGSDAVAGTVNIILKEDFEGLEISGGIGGSTEFGDFGRRTVAAIWGTGFDRGNGNLALSAQYTDAESLAFDDRPATSSYRGFQAPMDPNSPYSLQLYEDLIVAVDNTAPYPLYFGNQFFFNVFGNGIALDITDPNSPMSQFDTSGNLIPFVPGGGTGSPFLQMGGDGLNLAEHLTLYHEVQRTNSNLFLDYDLRPTTRLIGEIWLSRTKAAQPVNQAWFNSPGFGGLPTDGYGNVNSGPIPVLIDNPFLPVDTRQAILAAINVVHDLDGNGIADPTIDTNADGIADAVGFWRGGSLASIIGDNGMRTRRDLTRFVAGLDGELSAGGRAFYWDAFLTYGEVRARSTYLVVDQPRFEQAVQVSSDISGNPVCVNPGNGCVALNVIGMPSAEAIEFVSESVTDKVVNTQQVFSANISGDLWKLPAGVLSAASGIAYRKESSEFDLNALARSGDARTNLGFNDPVDGEFSSRELYVETLLPLLGGNLETPLVEILEFEGAFRYVDNSVAGSDTTWTAGLRYQPIADLEFRGNITESIRAPSITELFTPESTIGIFAADPCDARFVASGNFPATRSANCSADGIGQPFNSIIASAAILGTTSGNPELESEIANSFTYGVIIRPRWLDGLTVSVDWFDIEIDNAIEDLSATAIMNACYDSPAFPAEPACRLFTRDAQGQVDTIRTGFVNATLLEFQGVQSAISFSQEFDRLGMITWRLNHLYTDRYRRTIGSGNPVRLDGRIGRSRHRITTSLTWAKNRWSWFTQFRWLDEAVFDNSDDEFTRDVSGVGDWFIVDTSVSYSWDDRFEVQLNVDNVFNEGPPKPCVTDYGCQQAYFPGVLGRYAMISARARF
jgi:outer membrane receptor protein involved in Fe transport